MIVYFFKFLKVSITHSISDLPQSDKHNLYTAHPKQSYPLPSTHLHIHNRLLVLRIFFECSTKRLVKVANKKLTHTRTHTRAHTNIHIT